MCGIVGYVGHRNATDVLIDGLRRLEYRGYDSAGVAVNTGQRIEVKKFAGKLAVLRGDLDQQTLNGTLGVGHTRWATHGRPNDINAHPHSTEDGQIVIIHNGIIENYLSLKKWLLERGHIFASETDSEVLAHLIEEYYQGDLAQAVRQALAEIKGAFSLVVTHQNHREIVAARTVSPLVLGLGDNENFLASDVPALLPYTRKVVFLHDGDMAILEDGRVVITDFAGNVVERPIATIDWSAEDAEKGGFEHFMLKEIFEQPQTLGQTLGGRMAAEEGEVLLDLHIPTNIEQVTFLAMGTANIAGMYGALLIEQLAKIPARAELAAEYRYRDPVASAKTLAIVVSQSGESIDTLEGVREAKRKNAKTLGIINAKGSTITREIDDTLYIHCGPEIGVASTKAYTSMLAAEVLLAVWLGRKRGTLSQEEAKEILIELHNLPKLIDQVLERRENIRKIAEKFKTAKDFLFLGRGLNVPTAYEGALKLKEISYIHAEAYPTSEMKHGPIALIDENMPVLVIATASKLYDKTLGNIQEVKARSGVVITLASDGDKEVTKLSEHTIFVPKTLEVLSPIVNVIALQILAYEMAVILGCDVDQPRNLAKSVTVE